MTLIALTCQNRRDITEHAGQCRNFLIYAVQGQEVGEPRLLELPLGASFHDLPGDQPHALDGVDLLISASMGDGLRRKLAQRGMRTLITSERNPLHAVQRYLRPTPRTMPSMGTATATDMATDMVMAAVAIATAMPAQPRRRLTPDG